VGEQRKKNAKRKHSEAHVTHPFAVESGDLFSSIESFVTADALADDELAAVAPTTF
jgi:hypothetical protein